jgi:acetyl esterase
MRQRWIAIAVLASVVPILESMSIAAAQRVAVRIESDIRYVSGSRFPLLLDAYLPRGDGPHAAVLVIPGGKWVEGSKDENTWVPTQLAEAGFAAFALNYRPATTAPYPAALGDVQAAVRFIRRNASRFHVDPARIGALGGSSGGHLAALLATWGDGPTTSGARIAAAASLSGPMELVRLLHPPGIEVVEAVRTFLGCSATGPCDGAARAASPATHVDPTDGALYLSNSTDEIIPLDQATRMAALLARNDVPHQLTEANARLHGWGLIRSYKGWDPMIAFLKQRLGVGGATSAPSSSPSPQKPGAAAGAAVSRSPEAVPTPEKDVRAASDSPRWLPALALAALVLAAGSLFLTGLTLRSFRRGVRAPADHSDDGPPAPGSDPEPEELVGTRSDRAREDR